MPAPIIALGMTAAQLAALGISALSTTLGLGMSSSAKATANRRASDSKKSGDEMLRKLTETLKSSNYYKNLGIQKGVIENQLDRAIAEQASYRLGTTDQTFAQSGVPQLQTNLNKILDQATAAESKQMQDIAFKAAGRDQDIADSIAGLQAGQANQKYKDSLNEKTAARAYANQQGKIAAAGLGSIGEQILPTVMGSLDSRSLGRGLDKALGEQTGAAYFSDQLKNLDDVSSITNPALQSAVIGNATFGQQLADLAAQGDNEAIKSFLVENLDSQNLMNITKDISSTLDIGAIYEDVDQDIINAGTNSGGQAYGLLGMSGGSGFPQY